jgi:D-glycero-D-manno-heptose 1,7-bisphosphate phosphatase
MGIGGAVTRPAVFLDRDGVIMRAVVRNGKPYAAASLSEVEILPGVPDALARLQRAGYDLIVVTNQPEVARGTISREAVESIHARLLGTLPLEQVLACFHDDKDGCGCRKPAPGMLLDAARDRGVDLSRSFMVGDRWRDVEAGIRAGCRTVWIDSGYDERQPVGHDMKVRSLSEAAAWICSLPRTT